MTNSAKRLEFAIHGVMLNDQIRNKRFTVKALEPERYGVSRGTAYRVLRDLDSLGIAEKAPRHSKSWRLTRRFKNTLTGIRQEERKQLAKEILSVVHDGAIPVTMQFALTNKVKRQILTPVSCLKRTYSFKTRRL